MSRDRGKDGRFKAGARSLETLLEDPRLRVLREECQRAFVEFQERKRIDAFWGRVDKSGGDDACWLWRGGISPSGYGMFRMLGECQAHRISYALTHGRRPGRWRVRHGQDCPRHCVNPRYLKRGTAKQNREDARKAGRAMGGKKFAHGEFAARTKFAEMQVRAALKLHAEGYRLPEIASITGIDVSNLSQIVRRISWTRICLHDAEGKPL